MNIKEQIRDLLEAKYNIEKIGQHGPSRNGKTEALREAIELIDALPEQPVDGLDLEKEIDDYIKGCLGSLTGREIASCARYFYELGQQSRPEQPVSDHHEIEVEFRGEKVTISREFYRKGDKNYSTGEQDDNAIWSALRAWCEKKGITPFELYPKQPEQPVEGLEEAAEEYENGLDYYHYTGDNPSVAFKAGAEWMKSKYEK